MSRLRSTHCAVSGLLWGLPRQLFSRSSSGLTELGLKLGRMLWKGRYLKYCTRYPDMCFALLQVGMPGYTGSGPHGGLDFKFSYRILSIRARSCYRTYTLQLSARTKVVNKGCLFMQAYASNQSMLQPSIGNSGLGFLPAFDG